jgi:hypothetical protein
MQQTQRPAEPSVPDRDERPVLPKTARRADAADSDLETAATREVGEQPAHDRPALDPLELALSRPTLPGLAVPAPFVESVPRATAWVDPMVAEIVQSLAWGGDRRRGAARIELSGKKLGGASVVVHAEDGELTLELTAPAHVNALELGERLKERLERRGFAIRSLSAR